MSTGPRNPDGKTRSSLNRLTHGCCSESLILPKESEDDWNKLRQAWIDDYQPHNSTFLSLLVETARAEWFLRRKTREYQKFEHSLYDKHRDSIDWSEEDHRAIERFTRYLTTAERRFHRHRNAVEQTRKNRELEAHRRRSLDLQLAQEEQPARKAAKNAKTQQPAEPADTPLLENEDEPRPKLPVIPSLTQWANISIEQGATTTHLHPSNQTLLEQSKTMAPAPELVYRNLHFHGPIPPEYRWVRKEIPGISTAREQILTFDEWLDALAREELAGTGHIGPKNPDDMPCPDNPAPNISDEHDDD
jgi:hypothetical protein